MTHIEQMIKDMCPEGVVFKTLGEVCTCTKGQQLNKSGLLEEGYPVINGGINPSGYWNEYNYPANTITISQGGASAGYVNYIKTPFWAGAHCYVLINAIPEINYKFLYYLVKQSEPTLMQCQYGAGIPALGAKTVNALEIPVPPIEIQQRIVAILDAFSALAAELQAELQMRRKQYEYYRTQLLTPHSDCNSADNTDDCKWVFKALGDITFLAKERIPAEELSEDNYVSVENLLSNKLGKTLSESVPVEGAFIKYIKNDILVGNIRPYLRKIWFADTDGGTNGDVLTIRIKEAYKTQILPRFLFHVLSSEEFFFYDTNFSKGAKMPRGDKDKVMQYPVAIPSLEEQARIVAILDKFEKLITSMEEGIPAEQAAQQKRYEYYRDKLLTFEKQP